MKINQLTVRRFSSKRSSVIWFIGGLGVLIGFPLLLLLISPKNDYALYDAIDRNDSKVVNTLLERGADVNQRLPIRMMFLETLVGALNRYKQPQMPSPLGYAVSYTNQVPKMYGTIPSNPNTWYLREENIGLIKILLDHGAKLDDVVENSPAQMYASQPPFALAVRQNKIATVKLLLAHGVTLSNSKLAGTQILVVAFNAGSNINLSLFKFLLTAGANVNEVDDKGKSTLTLISNQFKSNQKWVAAHLNSFNPGLRKNAIQYVKKYTNAIQLLKSLGAK